MMSIGQTRTATDVWFQADRMNTLTDDWLEVPDDIAAMPDIRGFGNVYSLQQAMVRDAANDGVWKEVACRTGRDRMAIVVCP